MARFKGRVIKISGSKITIDTRAETRTFKTKYGEIVKSAAWMRGDMPKIGAVVRCNFHNRDKR